MSGNTDKPKFSASWDEPCLTRTEDDGSKTEWYERDLSGPTMQIMADLLSYIDQSSKLMPQFESAQSVVQHMASLNKNQELLFEKLVANNQGKKIVEGAGTMQVVSKIITQASKIVDLRNRRSR